MPQLIDRKGLHTLNSAAGIAYIKAGGNRCIFCGSPDIEGYSVRIEGGSAYQDIHCLSCDADFTDAYHLESVYHGDSQVDSDGTLWSWK